MSKFGPDEGGKIINWLLAVQEVTRKPSELPKMSRTGSGAGAGFIPCGMLVAVLGRVDGGDEDDGLVAAGTFAEVTEIPEGCDVVDAKWLYKWKSDSHGMVDRAKARIVAMGYSQVEGVDYF